MADVPISTLKIQTEEVSSDSPATSSTMYKVGGAINYLIDVGFQTVTYETAGSFNWLSPPLITRVHVQMIGGGGGGASGLIGGPSGTGGGGGAGGSVFNGFVNVTPNTNYTVNVGAGGAGGAANGGIGGDGGASSFFLTTVLGGAGAKAQPAGGSGVAGPQGFGAAGGQGGGVTGNPGTATHYAVGGPSYPRSGPTFDSGGGGGAGFDAGGSGSTNIFGTRGSGGGGSLGTDVGATAAGGAGGDGVVILTWFGST